MLFILPDSQNLTSTSWMNFPAPQFWVEICLNLLSELLSLVTRVFKNRHCYLHLWCGRFLYIRTYRQHFANHLSQWISSIETVPSATLNRQPAAAENEVVSVNYYLILHMKRFNQLGSNQIVKDHTRVQCLDDLVVECGVD